MPYPARVPSLDDLALTIAAADGASFGAVAHARHVSQSTVSRSVQRVEAALGAELFERDGRSVRVKTGTEPLIAGLRAVVAGWEGLRPSERPRVAPLALFCTVTASQTIVPDVLASFRRAHPDVVLHLRTGPASRALDAAASGEVDAAIAPLPRRLPRALASVEIVATPLVAVAALDLAVAPQWQNAHIIVPRAGVTRELVDRWISRSLAHAYTVQETDGHEEVVALAALGSGIGIAPQLVFESSALRPRLRQVTPPARLPTMRIGLCARQAATTRSPLADLWALITPRQPKHG